MADLQSGFVEELRNPVPRVLTILASYFPAVSTHCEKVPCREIVASFGKCQPRSYLTLLFERQVIHDQEIAFQRPDGHTEYAYFLRTGAMIVELIPRAGVCSKPVLILIKLEKDTGYELENILPEYFLASNTVPSVD